MRVRFADCDLDLEARQLVRAGQDTHLSPKAFELLKVLVEERPRAMSKHELLDRIWPGVFVSDASLARAASEIRDAIGDHSRSEGFLQTVHAFGYRFAAAGVVDVPGALEPGKSGVCWLVGRDYEFHLGEGSHVVGREAGVPIRIDSPKVSRHHARVSVAGDEVLIEDLGSKNGTFVRGERIQASTVLAPGDEVQIGPIKLVLRIVSDSGTVTEIWGAESG
jgi:DNA-binding winged helix-turn-helix (wHTH) protein